MKADQPEPYGFIVSSEIDGGGYPAFKIQRLLGPREDALGQALRDMRQNFGPQRVLFIREDGQHEVWSRDFLEKEKYSSDFGA